MKMLLLSLIVAVLLFGCATQQQGPSAIDQEREEMRLRYETRMRELRDPMNRLFPSAYTLEGAWVMGWVTNNKPNAAASVRIEFGLYDKSGALLGTTLDMMERLYTKEVWKYRCPVLYDGVETVKLRSLNYE